MTDDADTLEARLTNGLNRIATATPMREPGTFDPHRVPRGRAAQTKRAQPKPSRWLGRRGRLAAVVLVMVAGLAALATRSSNTADSPDTTTGAAPQPRLFATPTVRLKADTVEMITPTATFVPPADVSVHSDPGTANKYTTLELEWPAGGGVQRIYCTSPQTAPAGG